MKIYTRTGDQGTTALFGGDRVDKTHPRIEAYGTVDETNSLLGLARAQLRGRAGAEEADAVLHRLQNELLVVGADLATPSGSRADVPRVTAEDVRRLERDVDRFDEALPVLKNFVLPGGIEAGATLHLARTVCRRAERLTVAAVHRDAASGDVVVYLNRLSDLLFVLARWVNVRNDAPDEPWTSRDH